MVIDYNGFENESVNCYRVNTELIWTSEHFSDSFNPRWQ